MDTHERGPDLECCASIETVEIAPAEILKMTFAANHPDSPLTPEDIAQLAMIQRGNEGLRALLCTLARQGAAFRQAYPDRSQFLCQKLSVYPLYKGGQFLFDLMEWEDFMLDGPPPDLLPPLSLATLLTPLASLFQLFQDYLQRNGTAPGDQAVLPSPARWSESVAPTLPPELPPLESSFYLYRDVVLGWLGPRTAVPSNDSPDGSPMGPAPPTPSAPPAPPDSSDNFPDGPPIGPGSPAPPVPPDSSDNFPDGSPIGPGSPAPLVPPNPSDPIDDKIEPPMPIDVKPKPSLPVPSPGDPLSKYPSPPSFPISRWRGWALGGASALLLSLALGGTTWFWVTSRNQVQQRIAQAQQHQQSFENYQTEILQLVRDGLQTDPDDPTAPSSPALQEAARALTLTVSRELRADPLHKGQLLQFLYQLDLVNQAQPKIQLGTVNLQAAELVGANLQGVNLNGADLRRANLDATNLRLANLQGSDLTGADLTGADLRCANLQYANLEGVDFTEANLAGTRFKGAKLDEAATAQLQQASTPIDCDSLSGNANPDETP